MYIDLNASLWLNKSGSLYRATSKHKAYERSRTGEPARLLEKSI